MQRVFDIQPSQLQLLFDIKVTQLQMVRDRGFNITESEIPILNGDMNYFRTYITRERATPRALMSRFYETPARDRRLLVFFGEKTPQSKQVSADIVRGFIEVINQHQIREAILIVDANLSQTAQTELEGLSLVKKQIFSDSELTFNPILRVSTPRHVLVPKEEEDEKLRQMKVGRNGLPLMKLTDPITKYYGWESGMLIKIYRNDDVINVLAPESINYRIIAS